MIRDITIGQYYPVDSVLHRLDPRVKLFATVIYIIALFTFKGLLGLAIISAFLFAVIRLSKVPFKFMFRRRRKWVLENNLYTEQGQNQQHQLGSGF